MTVAEYCEAMGISVDALGSRAGVASGTMHRLKVRKGNPNAEICERLISYSLANPTPDGGVIELSDLVAISADHAA